MQTMEYYAAVPKVQTKTRSRCKNRHPNDDFSFAPLTHLEIRRHDSESPTRKERGKKQHRSVRAIGWCFLAGLATFLLAKTQKHHFRFLASTAKQMPRGELLREVRQHLAQLALDRQVKEQVFDTHVTTRQSVLEKGFPRQWKSCTFQEALQRRGRAEPLRLVILGGAGSAKAAPDCPGGRYSNMLEADLIEALQLNATDSIPAHRNFEVLNMAHAIIKPSVQGLLLDRLVDVHKADVLIWERSRRDFNSADHHDRELGFWLSRVAAHFGQYGLAPPPILVLNLWDDLHKLDNPLHSHQHHAIQQQMSNRKDIVDKFQGQWNIQVINVGKTVLEESHFKYPGELVDKKYHGTCRGMKLVSDMIQHVLYKDLAECNRTLSKDVETARQDSKEEESTQQALATPPGNNANLTRHTTVPLSELLLRHDVRVGSLSHWKPQADSPADLRVNNTHTAVPYLKRMPSRVPKAIPTEGFERISYHLPLCNNSEHLNLTLAEPNLEWLGMIYSGGRVDASLNGAPLSLDFQGKAASGLEGVNDWVHVAEILTPAAEYDISLCSRKIDKNGTSTVWLHQLVGVMLP